MKFFILDSSVATWRDSLAKPPKYEILSGGYLALCLRSSDLAGNVATNPGEVSTPFLTSKRFDFLTCWFGAATSEKQCEQKKNIVVE